MKLGSAAAVMLASLWLAMPARAGTWIVDDSGGADFTDLPAAIAAAAPGDLLVVRDGHYSSFILTKGLAIVADTGASPTLVITPGEGTAWIRDVPAGQSVIVSGFELEALRVQACDGAVHIDDCFVHLGRLTPAASVVNSDLVVLSRLDLRAGSGTIVDLVNPAWLAQRGLDVRHSTVLATQCNVEGGHGGTQYKTNGVKGEPAVHAENSTVVLQSCTLRGGYGGNGWFDPSGDPWISDGGPGAPAVRGLASTLRLFGAGEDVEGGEGGMPDIGMWGASAPAVELDGSDLRWSGVTWVLGDDVSEPIAGGTASEAVPAVPVLAVSGDAQLGGSVTLEVGGEPGAPFVMLASSVPAHVPVGSKPMPLVLGGSLLSLFPAALDGSGGFTLPLGLPTSSVLQGLPVHLQPFVKPSGSPSELGAAASFVLK
jgi:hypothetical protein